MLIAQISDTHMMPPGEHAFGGIDTADALRAAVRTVNAARPDLVIHTGDIANHGAPAAYDHTLAILADLEAPLYAIPGNHDDRAAMRAAFRGSSWLPADNGADGFIHYVIDAGPLALVALDSTIPGEVGGMLCEARLTWLEAALEGTAGRPTIIALHHPPFAPGLEGFSKTGLGNAERLAEMLGRHPHVVRLIAGHIHRLITGMCGTTPTIIGPSACAAFAFDTTPGAALAVSGEPPGIALHLWRPEIGLLSHAVAIGDYGAPRPLHKATPEK